MPQGSEAIIPSGMEWHQTTTERKYAFTKQPLYRVPPPLQTLCIEKSMEAVRLEICRCESVQILQAPNYCLAIASTRLLKAFNYLCYQQLPTIAVKSIAKSTQQGTSNKYCPILPVSISIGINISISIALYYHRYCRPVGIVGLSR